MWNALSIQTHSTNSCISLAPNLGHHASLNSINARETKSPRVANSLHKISFSLRTQRKTQALAMATNVDEGVKVLGVRWSPFVIRVLVALDLKGIHYDFIEEDLKNKSELLLKMNPVHKKIPVMIHDGKPVCESLTIVQYIDDVWTASHPLLPTDPYQRAQARFWTAFIDDKLQESLRRVLTNGDKGIEDANYNFGLLEGALKDTFGAKAYFGGDKVGLVDIALGSLFGAIFANPDKETQKKAIEDASHNFGLLEGALKDTFGGKPYFGGDKVGLVDIALGSLFGVIKASESLGDTVLIDEHKTPLLAALLTLFEETDGVKGNLPDPNFYIELFRKRYHS